MGKNSSFFSSLVEFIFPKPLTVTIFVTDSTTDILRKVLMRIEESSENVRSRDSANEKAYSFGGMHDDVPGYYLLRQCGECPTKYHEVGIRSDELWTLPEITLTIGKILTHEQINFYIQVEKFESRRKALREFLNGK